MTNTNYINSCADCPFFKDKFHNQVSYCDLLGNRTKENDSCNFVAIEREMNDGMALRVLHEFQKWRRGKGKKMIKPYVIGKAIDEAIRCLRAKNKNDYIKLVDEPISGGISDNYESIVKELLSIIPSSEFDRLKCSLGEFCTDFVGFVEPYYHLSKILSKDYTIIDFGAGYNSQSYFFKDFKKYIAVNPSMSNPLDDGMFCPPNCEIYRMTTKDFLEKVDYPKEKVFAICNYVPNWFNQDSIDLVHRNFRNCYTFYPD